MEANHASQSDHRLFQPMISMCKTGTTAVVIIVKQRCLSF